MSVGHFQMQIANVNKQINDTYDPNTRKQLIHRRLELKSNLATAEIGCLIQKKATLNKQLNEAAYLKRTTKCEKIQSEIDIVVSRLELKNEELKELHKKLLTS